MNIFNFNKKLIVAGILLVSFCLSSIVSANTIGQSQILMLIPSMTNFQSEFERHVEHISDMHIFILRIGIGTT